MFFIKLIPPPSKHIYKAELDNFISLSQIIIMESVTPSPTFSEDCDYWEKVDRISEQYAEAVQNEESYLLEYNFDINKSIYKVVTGFSAARGYVPAVKLLLNVKQHFTTQDNISFNREDWNDFVCYLQQFIIDYFEVNKNSEEMEVKFSRYTLLSSQVIGSKSLKISNGFCSFYLSENTVRELLRINKLISSHMDLLNSLNFEDFYNTFLNVANNILNESNYESSPYNVMLNLCDLYPCNIQTYCIRECLFYNRDKILNDLDRKMFLLNA